MQMSRRYLKRFDRVLRIRRREFDLITSALRSVTPIEQSKRLKILEFGSGAGAGAQYLCQLGDVVATDIYRHRLLELPAGVDFRIADIHNTDFKDNEFDILVSNQVLEYLDLPRAFREMKRIGNEDALYAFSVPTSTWLILSVFGGVLKKFENLFCRIEHKLRKSDEERLNEPSEASAGERIQSKSNWLSKFAICGHGYQPGFFKCLKSWRVGSWRKMLESNGFVIVSKMPLLFYGSSNFPIIPANRFLTKLGLSSSFLFICRESDGTS